MESGRQVGEILSFKYSVFPVCLQLHLILVFVIHHIELLLVLLFFFWYNYIIHIFLKLKNIIFYLTQFSGLFVLYFEIEHDTTKIYIEKQQGWIHLYRIMNLDWNI